MADELALAARKCRRHFIAAGLFSGAINLLYLSSPLYLMQIYNRVLVSNSFSTLGALTVVLVIALGTMAILDSIRVQILVRAGLRMDRLLATRVFRAMITRSAQVSGPRNAQLLRDLDQLRTFGTGPGVHFIFDAPWIPLYIGILFLIHPWLGVTATVGALSLLGLAVLNEFATRAPIRASEQASRTSYAFSEGLLRHADVVQAMGMHGNIERRWMASRSTMLSQQAAASDRNGAFSSSIRFSRLLLQSAMLGIGAWLAIDQAIQPATIFAASIVMGRALVPVEQAVAVWKQFGMAREAYGNVGALLRQAPPEPKRTVVPRSNGSLDATDLVYAFAGRARPVLRGVSLKLEEGRALGIVGPSGSGKSTLARLLIGAMLPASGRIRFGGIDLKLWDRGEFGRQVGFLSQEVGLFAGTIKENIARFGDASAEEIVAAAKLAGVHEMILQMPQGYDTLVGDGGQGLSGGQRQRIGLARALLGDPALVVLDEPNSNLDTSGELALKDALITLKERGTTIVLVTHRPSALAVVDELMVVTDGVVTESGPAEEVFALLRRQQISRAESNPPRDLHPRKTDKTVEAGGTSGPVRDKSSTEEAAPAKRQRRARKKPS